MANPIPEIMPDDAYAGGAAVVGTGRSDFPTVSREVSISAPQPDLLPTAFSGELVGVSGGHVFITWTVRNAGGYPAIGPWTTELWLSTDESLGVGTDHPAPVA